MDIRRYVGGHVIPVQWWTPELHRAVAEIPSRVWDDSVLRERSVLNALRPLRPADTRIIILGQDPYPAPGKANGLAFGIWSEWEGDRTQSSSGNIAREACRGEIRPGFDFTLESWAKQGVLLLNTDLSVLPGKPGSHRGVWREVVAEIIDQVPPGVVWIAWGREAANFAARHRHKSDFVLASTHPCRYSAGRATPRLRAFIGSDCFGAANRLLTTQLGHAAIKWTSHQETENG